MVRKYEARGTELGGDAFYEDWVEVVRYEDYAELELKFNTLREWRTKILNEALGAVTAAVKAEAELQKYKDQFPDYVECANCGSITHVEGIEDTMGQSGRRKEDAQECVHKWDIDGDYMMQCVRCGKIE